MPWYFLVVEKDNEIIPLAKLNLGRRLTDAEKKKIAKELSGSRMLRWGLRFSLPKVSQRFGGKKINLKGAYLMSEDELREAGFNPGELSVIIVPGRIG